MKSFIKNKIAILLNMLSNEDVNIFDTFKFKETMKDTYDADTNTLEEYRAPKKSVVFEGYNFSSTVLQQRQSVVVHCMKID